MPRPDLTQEITGAAAGVQHIAAGRYLCTAQYALHHVARRIILPQPIALSLRSKGLVHHAEYVPLILRQGEILRACLCTPDTVALLESGHAFGVSHGAEQEPPGQGIKSPLYPDTGMADELRDSLYGRQILGVLHAFRGQNMLSRAGLVSPRAQTAPAGYCAEPAPVLLRCFRYSGCHSPAVSLILPPAPRKVNLLAEVAGFYPALVNRFPFLMSGTGEDFARGCKMKVANAGANVLQWARDE